MKSVVQQGKVCGGWVLALVGISAACSSPFSGDNPASGGTAGFSGGTNSGSSGAAPTGGANGANGGLGGSSSVGTGGSGIAAGGSIATGGTAGASHAGAPGAGGSAEAGAAGSHGDAGAGMGGTAGDDAAGAGGAPECVLPAQTPGDCKIFRCSSSGAAEQVADDTDIPANNNPCRLAACAQGTPSNVPLVRGSSCPTGQCDATGTCVNPCAGSVVISQVYGGGGNAGATYANDFIELHNRGTTAVSLAGWSVQYAAANSTTWFATALNGTLAAGGYYLVQEAAGTSGGGPLPFADTIGTIAMSATAGKVVLLRTAAPAFDLCPSGTNLVDLVGYGATDCFEGGLPALTLSNITSAQRLGSGCSDTGQNGGDFTNAGPFPRSSATQTQICTSCAIVLP